MLYVSIAASKKAANIIAAHFAPFAVLKRARNGKHRGVVLRYAVRTRGKAYMLMAAAIQLGARSAHKHGRRRSKAVRFKNAKKKAGPRRARFSSLVIDDERAPERVGQNRRKRDSDDPDFPAVFVFHFLYLGLHSFSTLATWNVPTMS
ncbi:MAG TPA: hypothetical protein VHD37_02980 [Candidatus Paceibacterota bacterium]|nr:hypothetical protein [Candidatus Paceibacterota bacterium]